MNIHIKSSHHLINFKNLIIAQQHLPPQQLLRLLVQPRIPQQQPPAHQLRLKAQQP